MKHSRFASRSGLAGALARTGIAGIMVGLVLVGGTAAGASASTMRVAHVSAGQAGQPDSQTPPAAPTGLVATAGTGQVSLSWNASASGATSYDVHVGTAGDFQSSTKVATVRGLDYTVPNLTSGSTYYFWVTAANSTGTSSSSNVASATPKPPTPTPPGAPAGLRATAGHGQVTLSWAAPASNGGSAITGYRIYVGTNKTLHGASTVDTKGPGTRAVVSGLSAGRTYCFAVAAVNAYGVGPLSPGVWCPPKRPTITAPGAPGGLRATAGQGQVTLSWAAPASNGGSPLTVYRIYVGTTKTLHGALAVDTKDAGTRVVVPGLSAGRTYYFAVAAVNAHGAGPASSVTSARLSTVGPPPPAGPGYTGPGYTGPGYTGQGSTSGSVQVATDGAQPSPAPTLDLPQDPSSSGTPTGLIALLAGVAAAALAGVAGMAIHIRRLRIRQNMPEPFRPGESEESDNRPLSGGRYR
jgi:fibronectin type III domain protein